MTSSPGLTLQNLGNSKRSSSTSSEGRKPLVLVMGPVCRPVDAWARYNMFARPEGWEASYFAAAPIARLCGEAADTQLRGNRHFVNEQPVGSTSYYEPPWPKVLANPKVVSKVFAQCMTGLHASCGKPAQKRTELKASDPALADAQIAGALNTSTSRMGLSRNVVET